MLNSQQRRIKQKSTLIFTKNIVKYYQESVVGIWQSAGPASDRDESVEKCRLPKGVHRSDEHLAKIRHSPQH